MDKTAIRDAATLIMVRDPDSAPRVLMGRRGTKAAFMPNRFVFPGGALDAADRTVPLATPLPAGCVARLEAGAAPQKARGLATGLAAAAIRELWEETGLILGAPGAWPGKPPGDWQDFAKSGLVPAAGGLAFVFRAITPPGRPRRFDARFFVADAGQIAGDPDDFSAASDELSDLQWIPLDEVRHFKLPFVTEVVLAEVAAALPRLSPPQSVPFLANGVEEKMFRELGGVGPMQTYRR